MSRSHITTHPADVNYGYIEYYQKAYEYETDPIKKDNTLHLIRETTASRDFFAGSLRQINHLFQIDGEPNRDLTDPKWEIYKISVNFTPAGKTFKFAQSKI